MQHAAALSILTRTVAAGNSTIFFLSRYNSFTDKLYEWPTGAGTAYEACLSRGTWLYRAVSPEAAMVPGVFCLERCIRGKVGFYYNIIGYLCMMPIRPSINMLFKRKLR
jgi:hypothetical protein